MSGTCDVIVLGGGPSGLALACILARRGARVVVLERRQFGGSQLGELVGNEAEPALRDAGVWDAFQAMKPRRFAGVRAAWGSAIATVQPLVTRPAGAGWHVERQRLTRLLVDQARAVKATLCEDVGVAEVTAEGDGWQVTASDATWSARFLVDASGRGGPATAVGIPTRRWFAFDRQVAVVTWGRPPSPLPVEPELLMESSEDGWWYASPQPQGTFLIGLLTDPDLVPQGPHTELTTRFRAALSRTLHVRKLVEGLTLERGVETVVADAGRLMPDQGRWWRAIGDAAFGGDPLSGDGVRRALLSASSAAASIESALARGVDAEGDATVPTLGDAFCEYIDRRALHYALETRWPEALYWRRRNAGDWTTIPLTLGLDAHVQLSGEAASRMSLAPSEAFIPLRAIRMVLNELAFPRTVAEVITMLRGMAPFADRRLHVAVQRLVQDGLLMAN